MKWKSDWFEGSSITKTDKPSPLLIIANCNHVKRVQCHYWLLWDGSTVWLENPNDANRKMWDLCPTDHPPFMAQSRTLPVKETFPNYTH